MTWIYVLDLFGTMVFAISGVLTAIDNKFDPVGSIIIGAVTAIGGGTLRDVLIGETPVGWMKDLNYIYAITIAVILSYIFKGGILKLKKSMFLFDTVGIGLFTILGLQKTLGVGLSIPVALLMGVVSAVFGGVIRDVLTNRVPLIFRSEIYATACLAGGIVFVGFSYSTLHPNLAMGISMLTVMVIRYLAIKNNWSMSQQ
ncbi:trimeric intracellular cation channel family protein [Gangjinia marincola]|uniref:Trimeric intracellular cation channel family protein n=1 Tax=Gangjinia marincola TaxID=578463 RepID=A0ABN1MGK7_9FLAO